MENKFEIDPNNLPSHIAVIMDGNGRWAQKQGAERIFGHQNAVKAVRDVSEGCVELGIPYLTLYAFSTENWGRPKEEVEALMHLLVSTIKREISTLIDNGIQLQTIGDIDSLPPDCQNELQEAIEVTSKNTKMKLILALSYSGRWEIAQAARKLADKVKSGQISSEEIDEQLFSDHLKTEGIPDPELLIRTSGEMRISNFLLWQMAYTELYFTDVLWPDFRKSHLIDAIITYQNRERRFGKIKENVNS